ncbi:hypothetical protein ACFFUE_08380 [Bergeyella porcorum]|uniref:Uncharacterized protein n=1 Tax=Bergeyella porcorum TaxID=1735111 RepID=A0AAU0F1E1_9FLAO
MTTTTQPFIAEELLQELQSQTLEERQVIVHCCFPASPLAGNLIRVWRSTFLVDRNSGHRSPLLHAENITIFPFWTEVEPMQDHWFTLIFAGLPNDCTSFDLEEIIPQSGGFSVKQIRRNNTDVYRVKIE